jgi:hypothetical protein
MKFLRVLAKGLGGVVAIVVLLYLVAVVINWRDEPPSESARRLAQVIDGRPAVPAAENAVVYLLGFTAPAGIDPVEIGARRLAWIEALTRAANLDSDPLPDPLNFVSSGSPAVVRFKDDCGWDTDRRGCADTFDAVGSTFQPNESDTLALARYQALLTRHAWRDAVPFDVRAPLPQYASVLYGQRVYMLHLVKAAAAGEADEVRAGLSADFAYWRGAVPAADNLISQMIALAALRHHFFYSQRVLRRLPAEQAALAQPADWSREISPRERSMLRAMAGELAFAERILRDDPRLFTELVENESPTAPAFLKRGLASLSKPLFKLQATSNLHADDILDFTTAFAVPVDQYDAASKQQNARVRSVPVSVYNVTGRLLYRSQQEVGTPYRSYAIRVATMEAWRRAVLLAARLHARGISAEAAAAEVAASELRDPFTNAPFEWNAEHHSVIFVGPESYRRNREEYFY